MRSKNHRSHQTRSHTYTLTHTRAHAFVCVFFRSFVRSIAFVCMIIYDISLYACRGISVEQVWFKNTHGLKLYCTENERSRCVSVRLIALFVYNFNIFYAHSSNARSSKSTWVLDGCGVYTKLTNAFGEYRQKILSWTKK